MHYRLGKFLRSGEKSAPYDFSANSFFCVLYYAKRGLVTRFKSFMNLLGCKDTPVHQKLAYSSLQLFNFCGEMVYLSNISPVISLPLLCTTNLKCFLVWRIMLLRNFLSKLFPYYLRTQKIKRQQICFGFAHQLSESDFEYNSSFFVHCFEYL